MPENPELNAAVGHLQSKHRDQVGAAQAIKWSVGELVAVVDGLLTRVKNLEEKLAEE